MLWQAGAFVVCVLADNDGAGRAHAHRVAKSLFMYRPPLETLSTDPNPEPPWCDWPCAEPDDPEVAPLQVKLVELPDLQHGGDVVNWLDAGHSADDLRELLDATPIWDPEKLEQARIERARIMNRNRQREFRKRGREKVKQLKRNTSRWSLPAVTVCMSEKKNLYLLQVTYYLHKRYVTHRQGDLGAS